MTTKVSPMDQLEQIIAGGNDPMAKDRPRNKIRCADGFTVSVIAHWGAYCTPPPQFANDTDAPATCGPFTAVEVGFPSEQPEPWQDWERYAEAPDNPTETVYANVPVGMVRSLIARHEVGS